MGTLYDKLTEYYDKLANPTYKIGDWIIADDELYLKYKNKLTFINILSTYKDELECVIVAETKSKYYAIKYNNNFICLRESDTEYGLSTGEYDLMAVNNKLLNEKVKNTNKKQVNNMTLKQLAKLLNWKLSKRSKEYLDYYK